MNKTDETIAYLEELTEKDCVVPEMCLDRITYAVVELKRQSSENRDLREQLTHALNHRDELATKLVNPVLTRQEQK